MRPIWEARFTAKTDMIETFEPEFWVISLRSKVYRWHWYDWDCLSETPWPKLARIWLRPPKNLFFLFDSTHLTVSSWHCETMKNNDGKFWDVSVISVSAGYLASHLQVVSYNQVQICHMTCFLSIQKWIKISCRSFGIDDSLVFLSSDSRKKLFGFRLFRKCQKLISKSFLHDSLTMREVLSTPDSGLQCWLNSRLPGSTNLIHRSAFLRWTGIGNEILTLKYVQ